MSRTPAFLGNRLASMERDQDHAARGALIMDALGDPSPPVREVAVAWAARCLEPAALLGLVADPANAVLRNSALAALERQGPYAVTYVEGATASTDADLAMFACQVLGTIGGPGSTGPLLAALTRPEINVMQAAAEALGRLQDRAAVPALVELLGGEPWLQLAAADALGAIGDPDAVPALLALLPDSFVAEPVLDALRRIGSPNAVPRLLQLLLDPALVHLRPPLLRALGAALQGAAPRAELRAAGQSIEADHDAGSLWQFVAERLSGEVCDPVLASADTVADDRANRRGGNPSLQAAAALVLAGGVSSLLPLVFRWGDDRDARPWLEPLVTRYRAVLGATLDRLFQHPDPAVRAGVVRLLPSEESGCQRLLVALSDASVSVRVAAAEALGRLADPRAVGPLALRLEGEAAAEREAAARALARFDGSHLEATLAPRLGPEASDPVRHAALSVLAESHAPGLDERVYQLAGSLDSATRRAALRAAAGIPGSRAEVLLLRALADRDPDIQVEALDLLVGRGGDKVVATLLALLAAGDSLRYHVIRALGRLASAEAAPALEALYPNAPLHERIEVVTALARIGGTRARAFLADCLAETEAEVRRVAARGLADMAGVEELELLHRMAQDPDWVLRSEAARGLGRLAHPGMRPVLLDLVRDLEPAVARTARAALAVR